MSFISIYTHLFANCDNFWILYQNTISSLPYNILIFTPLENLFENGMS